MWHVPHAIVPSLESCSSQNRILPSTRFASVTGTTATDDATLLFTFYVPRDSALSAPVLNANTGDDVPMANDASASGSWTPTDPATPPPSSSATPHPSITS